jgi:DNA-binding response OmpR family regulator
MKFLPKILVVESNLVRKRILAQYFQEKKGFDTKFVETIDNAFVDVFFWEPKVLICAESLGDGTLLDLLTKRADAFNSGCPFSVLGIVVDPTPSRVQTFQEAGCECLLRFPFSSNELFARISVLIARMTEVS